MYDKLTVATLAKSRMDWIARRQEVLSENIANANTPKYVPRDLTPYNFKEALKQTLPHVEMKVTSPLHIKAEVPDSVNVVSSKRTYESAPDGNAVILEEQMAKMGEAKSAYETAASLFQKQFKMFRTVLSRGS